MGIFIRRTKNINYPYDNGERLCMGLTAFWSSIGGYYFLKTVTISMGKIRELLTLLSHTLTQFGSVFNQTISLNRGAGF